MTAQPSIPEVVKRFVSYRSDPENGAWGSLHIVLSDGNVKDDNVRWCIAWAQERGDTEGEALGRLLLSMSKTQRLKLDNAVDAWLRDNVACPAGLK
jgi:hypothetical protein